MSTTGTTPANHPRTQANTLVGLIADSHGQVQALESALEFLRKEGCRFIYHLGDICDSLNPDSADACVRLLRSYRVSAVKGNNDHALVVNQIGRTDPSIEMQTLNYLKKLPLVVHCGLLVLAHSLPFENELGLSCMVGAMQPQYALKFFRRFPERILVRGHGHSPEITWQHGNERIASEAMPLEQVIPINARTPGIVTCGALDRGLCLLWSPGEGSIMSRCFQ